MPKPKNRMDDPGESEVKAAPRPEAKDGFQAQLEGWADSITSAIKYHRLGVWKEVLFRPTKTLAEQMSEPSLGRGAKDVFMASLPRLLIGLAVLGLVFAYFLFIGFFMFSAAPNAGIIALPTLIIGALVFLVLYFLGPIINWFLTSVVQFILAKILGGKANFTAQSYLIALSMAGSGAVLSLMLVLQVVLNFIPCIGWTINSLILRPLTMVVGLYGLYLNYKAIQVAHGLSSGRAAAVVILPVVLAGILAVLLLLGFYFGMFSLAFLARQN